MRIIYNYIFDVTKKLRREELIPCILHFMQQNNLKYENVLFELSSYKDNRRKGKAYFEKLWEKDLFWRKYRNEYKCNFSKNTNIVGISNIKEGDWIKRKIEKEDKLSNTIDKLEEQLKVMPQCSYKVAFNDITWFSGDKTKYPLIALGVPKLYPLSSNITIMKTYPQKRHIILSFEMCSDFINHKLYVEDFSNRIGCPYNKEVQFVKDDVEWEAYSRAYLQINRMLSQIENTKINVDNVECQEEKRLHIKKILANVFYEMGLKYEGNGAYEIYIIDKYHNKLEIYFDYDKEMRSLCATLAYKGLGYKYGVRYSEIKPILCDDVIKQYAEKVYSEVDRFVKDYVPTIISHYKPMPEWFEWE